MRFVFASYVVSKNFRHPVAWLHRIRAYTGMLESLSARHEVISIEQIDYEGEYAQNGVRYIFFRPPFADHYVPRRLHHLIRDLAPDVVVIQGLHFPMQVMQLRHTLGSKVRIIAQHHAELPFTGIKKYAQRQADRMIDGYLFASKPMGLGWVRRGNLASANKVFEVMEVSSVFYPIDRCFARRKTGTGAGPMFLWVGRLNQNKDPLTVLRAFLSVARSHPSITLSMIYASDELLPGVRALLERHPSGERVRLIGRIPHEDLLYWYNSADYFLSASWYEGSGAAVCEAMSCGCVPVVTDIESFRAMTGDGRCGYLYPPGDTAALAEILHGVQHTDNSDKRREALAFFRHRLSFQAIASEVGRIAETL